QYAFCLGYDGLTGTAATEKYMNDLRDAMHPFFNGNPVVSSMMQEINNWCQWSPNGGTVGPLLQSFITSHVATSATTDAWGNPVNVGDIIFRDPTTGSIYDFTTAHAGTTNPDQDKITLDVVNMFLSN